ncbi:peptidoglycan/LPS O-acetylase OafA/YrhL [Acidovorax sp. 100]|nr:peptidoglycan/LPS O-acetylase OafA/YrhL [Acidovorax sp. 100]
MDTSVSHKNSSIETLRALAVVLVFLHHLHSGANITLPYIAHAGGWLGVQIFFVISGYLIILSAVRYSFKEYAIHRLARIYPAYLFWFFVFSIITKQLTWQSLDLEALSVHLLFLQHFFPLHYYKYNALFVSWTLTIELIWYIVAFACATQFKKSPIKITLIFMGISYLWIFWGAVYFPHYKEMDSNVKHFFVDNNFFNQLPFFFFGALIAIKNPKFDKAGLATMFLLTVVLSSSWKSHFPDPIFITGFGVASLFLMLKDMDCENPKIVRFISEVSYSFYLVHYPVIVLITKITGNKLSIVFFSITVTLLISYLSHRFIEQPFINLSKRKIKELMPKAQIN